MIGRAIRIGRAGAALAAIVPVLVVAGCARVTDTLGMTGQIDAGKPRLIGEERLVVRLTKSGVEAVLGPVSRSGDTIVWQTLDGITLTLRGGVLSATRGLGDDLMSADVAGSVAMLRGGGGDGYYPQIRTHLDGEYQTEFRAYQCRREGAARQQVGVGGRTRAATRIEERCVSPDEGFTNIYWLDDAGTVIRSRQWIGPVIEYMETETILR